MDTLKNDDATNIVVETSEIKNELPLKSEGDGPKLPGSIFPIQDYSNPYVSMVPKKDRGVSNEKPL
jgi:hypothetical protein